MRTMPDWKPSSMATAGIGARRALAAVYTHGEDGWISARSTMTPLVRAAVSVGAHRRGGARLGR